MKQLKIFAILIVALSSCKNDSINTIKFKQIADYNEFSIPTADGLNINDSKQFLNLKEIKSFKVYELNPIPFMLINSRDGLKHFDGEVIDSIQSESDNIKYFIRNSSSYSFDKQRNLKSFNNKMFFESIKNHDYSTYLSWYDKYQYDFKYHVMDTILICQTDFNSKTKKLNNIGAYKIYNNKDSTFYFYNKKNNKLVKSVDLDFLRIEEYYFDDEVLKNKIDKTKGEYKLKNFDSLVLNENRIMKRIQFYNEDVPFYSKIVNVYEYDSNNRVINDNEIYYRGNKESRLSNKTYTYKGNNLILVTTDRNGENKDKYSIEYDSYGNWIYLKKPNTEIIIREIQYFN